MIKAFFVDVDNTILDFAKCSRVAMEAAFATYGIEFTERIYDAFHRINDALWKRIEAGTLTRAEHIKIRWNLIFEDLGMTGIDGVEFETVFNTEFRKTAIKVEHADEMMRYLSERYAVYIASNAREATQLARLERSGLMPYINGVFTSERVGAQKPSRKYFEACMAEVPYTTDEVVMLGDSPDADIIGASSCGITTVWFDKNKKRTEGIGDYRIESLLDIKNIF